MIINRQYTGVLDRDCDHIYAGDIVRILDGDNEVACGEVIFAHGAYGIVVYPVIDWERLEDMIPGVTGCNNTPCFCYADNFISLWEICWNFNSEDGVAPVLDIVKKAADSREG